MSFAQAKAETLADAIALAYQSNPSLQSQRAQQRALDENYVQATAGWRPQLGVQITSTYGEQQQSNFSGGLSDRHSNAGAAQLSFTQPVITGGRVSTAVKAAEFDDLAGREQLRATETSVLQSVIQAYADVLRDQQTLSVREADLGVLQSQLEDAQARKGAGEVTKTDVFQSLAQLQSSRAQLSAAQGQLQTSRAAYVAAVGQNPGDLAPLPPIPGMPADVDQAFDEAQANNPSLAQARRTEEASHWRIATARAANRPTISVQGSYGYTGALSPVAPDAYARAFSLQAVLTQSLYTAGVNSSNIRRAVALNENDRIQIEAARRGVVQQVSQAWNQMAALRQSLVSDEQEVATARQYFAGSEEEYRVGQRSTLDVLSAEQTLRGAEVAAIQARHDAYMAQTALLAAMGRLSRAALIQGAGDYDPSIYFRRAAHDAEPPWQGVVARLDSLSGPHLTAQRPLEAPSLADPPAPMRVARAGMALEAPPASITPTHPFAGSTSPATPAVYGRKVAFPPARAPAAALATAAGSPHAAAGSAPSYDVASGDTLYGVGRRYGVSPMVLATLNRLSDAAQLYVGLRLQVPVGARDGGAQAHAHGAATAEATPGPAVGASAAERDPARTVASEVRP